MSQKLNNLAELIAVQIDCSKLLESYEYFLSNRKKLIEWNYRVMVEPNFFDDYVANTIESICSKINQKPKNYILQVFDKRVYNEKTFLNVVHKDIDRKSCITMPIVYNPMESILFFKDIPGIDPKEYRKNINQPWPEKPMQVCRYSNNHPTLLNVQNLHNVRVLDNTSLRVLLQLSFDIGFDDLIEQNPSIWRIIR